MTDDLVKRLRDVGYCSPEDVIEAADCIEKFDAALVRTFNKMMEDGKRIETLEAALREPTLPMLLAGKKSLYSCSEDPEIEDARACFLAMARKALEGKDA
jgi:hypothetical protein